MFKRLNVLEIGSSNVKILSKRVVFSKPKIVTASIVKTPNSTINRGVIKAPNELYEHLQKYIEKAKVFSRDFEVVLSSPQIIAFAIKTDSFDKVINEIVKHDLEKYAYDYKIISEHNGELSIMLVFIPKNIIESYLEFFKVADINCKKIDFAGNCLAKSKFADKDGTMAIVDIGGNHTNAIIVQNGEFRSYRTFPYGGERMARVELTDEIESFFNLYALSGKNNRDVSKIMLVGGGSLEPNLDEFIMKHLSIPTIACKSDVEAIFATSI